MKKVTMQMERLTCPNCAKKIENTLKKAAGVASAEVLFNSSKAKVEYDEEATAPEALADVVRGLGYEVEKIS